MSPTFIQMAISFLAIALGGYVALWGDSKYFSKEKGEAQEQRHILLEQKVNNESEKYDIQLSHTNEKLDKLIHYWEVYFANHKEK